MALRDLRILVCLLLEVDVVTDGVCSTCHRWHGPEGCHEFTFHRTPSGYQLEDFERFKDAPYFALWWDPRMRKTDETLNIFKHRYLKGDVDALVVLSYPSGVKWVWAEEADKAFEPEFRKDVRVGVWESGKTVKGERRVEFLALRDHPGPVILSFNCEAVNVRKSKDYIEWFIRKRKVMLVLDESSFCARWSGRTKKVLALGDWWVGKRRPRNADPADYAKRPNVVVKAILDGSPVDEGPVDIFYPSEFLKPGLLGFSTLAAMRARYTQYDETIDPETGTNEHKNHRTGQLYKIVLGYRNLDELRGRMAEFGSRRRREDFSDAPPKVYQSQYFELTPKQRAVYDRLRDEYVADLSSGRMPVAGVLKRMTRLQMVARNYFPPETTGVVCDACNGEAYLDSGTECDVCHGLGYALTTGELERIDERNPATEALVEAAHTIDGPFVVWCRFRQDVDDACDALISGKFSPLRYYGVIPERQREMNYHAFKDHETGDCIVATEASGLGRGKDLSRAVAAIYYSNEWSLRTRRQTEDRTESVNRKFSTSIIDLIAANTRDLDVIEVLRNKRDVAAEIVGDPKPIHWL